MQKRQIIFCFSLFISLNIWAQSEFKEAELTLKNPITEVYIIRNLSKNKTKFILTPEIERRLKQKLKSDPLVKSFYKYLKDEANMILQSPLIQRDIKIFRMPAGIESLRSLGIFSMVYRVDKEPKILNRINEELLNLCQFEDWNPQHFLDIAHMSTAVALAIDWAGEDLPAETIKLSKTALIEKGIMPSYNEEGVRMGWIDGNNNWNTVCHSGMMIASLAIADVNPSLAAKTISRGLNKITNSLKEYGPDGVYPEGPGYWRFGTNFVIAVSSMLQSALGSDFGITATPGFMESARFRLLATAPSGDFYNFSDCDLSASAEGAMIMSWFASQTGNGRYINESFFKNPSEFKGDGGSGDIGRLSGLALIWLSEFEEKTVGDLPLEWFGNGKNPIAIFRGGDQDPGQFYLGVKGGSATISHANMDAGSFIFELNGVRWAIDQERQPYAILNSIGFQLSNYKQDGDRWKLLSTNNFGHSTMSINDSLFNVKGYAPITDFKKGGIPEVTIDMTDVLKGQVKSLQRKFTKESNQSVLIEDTFEINETTKMLTWQMMTVADVVPTKNGAILKQDGKELELSILSPNNLNISVISLSPALLAYDKQIKNLKRIEIRVPAYSVEDQKGIIQVRLSGEKKIICH